MGVWSSSMPTARAVARRLLHAAGLGPSNDPDRPLVTEIRRD